mgnify:FL=1
MCRFYLGNMVRRETDIVLRGGIEFGVSGSLDKDPERRFVLLDNLSRRYGISGEVRNIEDIIIARCDKGVGVRDSGFLYDIDIFNFVEFAEKVAKIKTKDMRIVPLVLNDAQRKFWGIWEEEMRERGRVRIHLLKARQWGGSTLVDAIGYWTATTVPHFDFCIASHRDKGTNELFERVKRFYAHTPDVLKPMRRKSNARELIFENEKFGVVVGEGPGLQSKITVQTGGGTEIGRGSTNHGIHISELDSWEGDVSGNLMALMNTLSDYGGTFCVVETTARGRGHFYDMWVNDDSYRKVFIGWQEVGEYRLKLDGGFDGILDEEERWLVDELGVDLEQIYWRRRCIRDKCQGSVKKFHQEFPAVPDHAFEQMDRTVFQLSWLDVQAGRLGGVSVRRGEVEEVEVRKEYRFREEEFGLVYVVEEPLYGFSYCIGADVAEGREVGEEGDYSVAYVLRRGVWDGYYGRDGFTERYPSRVLGSKDKVSVVAWYRGNPDTDIYADILMALGYWYYGAWVNVERNSMGVGVVDNMKLYPRMCLDARWGSRWENRGKKLGLRTLSGSKGKLIGDLVKFVREDEIEIYDKGVLDEMKFYINENGKLGAEYGKHDDRVMALALALNAHLRMDLSGPLELSKERHFRKKVKEYVPLFSETGY